MHKKDTKKKILLIILDGLSDRPQEKMKGRTPLQAAHTPTLDFLAKIGAVGRLQAYKPGIPPHSDLALFSILGYSDHENPSRSIFEALGKNVPLKEKDVVVSVSYDRVVKKNNRLYVKKSEVDLPEDTLARITKRISSFVYKDIKLRLYYTGKSYGTLIIENGSPHITDTDPFSKRLPVLKCLPLEGYNDPKTIATAEAINKYMVWVYENLKSDEANFILTKWAGTYTPIQPFSQRHGLKGVSFSPKKTINGLIRYLGMEYVNTNDMTFSEVVEKGIQNLKTFDFLHLHTIEPDHCSHLKDPHGKTRAIQAIDQALVPLKNLGGETVLAISADHTGPSTPGTLRHRHLPEHNPFTFWERLEMIRNSLLNQGLLREDFEIIPFPINYRERWKYYLPPYAVHFIRVKEPWSREKIDLFKNENLELIVLESQEGIGITATEVRRRLIQDQNWQELVPVGTKKVLEKIKLEKVS